MLWDMKFLYWIFYGSGAIVIKRCGNFLWICMKYIKNSVKEKENSYGTCKDIISELIKSPLLRI